MNKTSEGRRLILDELMGHILEIDLSTADLSNDELIAERVTELNRYTELVGIAKRLLADNPGYPEDSMTEEQAALIRAQIDRLSDALGYYRVRRMIVTNPYYIAHLNDELSMNVLDSDSEDQKKLARLLRAAYYLGKNLSITSAEDVASTQALTLAADGKLSEADESFVSRLSKDPRDYAGNKEWLARIKAAGEDKRESERSAIQEEIIQVLERENERIR